MQTPQHTSMSYMETPAQPKREREEYDGALCLAPKRPSVAAPSFLLVAHCGESTENVMLLVPWTHVPKTLRRRLALSAKHEHVNLADGAAGLGELVDEDDDEAADEIIDFLESCVKEAEYFMTVPFRGIVKAVVTVVAA